MDLDLHNPDVPTHHPAEPFLQPLGGLLVLFPQGLTDRSEDKQAFRLGRRLGSWVRVSCFLLSNSKACAHLFQFPTSSTLP